MFLNDMTDCQTSRCTSVNMIGWLLHAGASNFTEAMRMGSEVYHHLKNVIKGKYGQDGNKFLFYFLCTTIK